MTDNRRNALSHGQWRRAAALLVALCALLSLCAARAETVEIVEETTVQTATATGGLTNAEAAEGYINSILDPSFRRPRSANLGAKLTGNDEAIFKILKNKIAAVAAGTLSSTEFVIDLGDVVAKSDYTADDLGVEIIVNGAINGAAKEAAKRFYSFDLTKVNNALLNDYPYEMYWYDKTIGCSQSTGFTFSAGGSNGEYTLTVNGQYTIKFKVAKEYSAANAEDTTDFDTSKYSAYKVEAAAEDALSIVSANVSGTDYEKLAAYKQAICDRVEYNHDAAENDPPYGNPWQLIWVFDGDAGTRVVCEGYSKAFQYLCDLSTFTGDVSAICASGTLDSIGGQDATGAGPHMWNIVTMEDGNNYLVDVTNCDGDANSSTNSIGYPDWLFMKGYYDYYSDNGKYNYKCNDAGTLQAIYIYDEDQAGIFGSRLNLSQTDYTPGATPPDPIVVASGTWGDNALAWTLDDEGTLTIAGTGAMEDAENVYHWSNLTIKKAVLGEGVTSVAQFAFYGLEELETVVLPSTLKLIDLGAFADCDKLSGVTLPEGLVTLGPSAFESCDALTTLTLPASLEQLGESASWGIDCAPTVSVAPNSRYLTLTDEGLLIADGVLELGYSDSGYTSNWKAGKTVVYLNLGNNSVTIPNDVVRVSSYAMAMRAGLEVTVPDSVTTIGEDTFSDSTGVTIRCRGNSPAYALALRNRFTVEFIPYDDTLTLPGDTTTIESQAFANLGTPVNVIIPADVTSIATDAFEGSDVLLRYKAGTSGARAVGTYLESLSADTVPTPTQTYVEADSTP